MQFSFTAEEKQEIAKQLAGELIPIVIKEIRALLDLPPLLTRTQFMKLVGIGETKCAELFNRRDFPVNREFGHPRVPTELLFEWINANTDWVRANAPKAMHLYKAI